MNKTLITLALCFMALSAIAKDCLVVSKAPAGIELKKDFQVQARVNGGDWKDIDTYAFKVDRVADAKHNVEITSVAKFEFEGKVEIQVKSIAQNIKSYKIRPISYGIEAKQEGNTLSYARRYWCRVGMSMSSMASAKVSSRHSHENQEEQWTGNSRHSHCTYRESVYPHSQIHTPCHLHPPT